MHFFFPPLHIISDQFLPLAKPLRHVIVYVIILILFIQLFMNVIDVTREHYIKLPLGTDLTRFPISLLGEVTRSC